MGFDNSTIEELVIKDDIQGVEYRHSELNDFGQYDLLQLAIFHKSLKCLRYIITKMKIGDIYYRSAELFRWGLVENESEIAWNSEHLSNYLMNAIQSKKLELVDMVLSHIPNSEMMGCVMKIHLLQNKYNREIIERLLSLPIEIGTLLTGVIIPDICRIGDIQTFVWLMSTYNPGITVKACLHSIRSMNIGFLDEIMKYCSPFSIISMIDLILLNNRDILDYYCRISTDNTFNGLTMDIVDDLPVTLEMYRYLAYKLNPNTAGHYLDNKSKNSVQFMIDKTVSFEKFNYYIMFLLSTNDSRYEGYMLGLRDKSFIKSLNNDFNTTIKYLYTTYKFNELAIYMYVRDLPLDRITIGYDKPNYTVNEKYNALKSQNV